MVILGVEVCREEPGTVLGLLLSLALLELRGALPGISEVGCRAVFLRWVKVQSLLKHCLFSSDSRQSLGCQYLHVSRRLHPSLLSSPYAQYLLQRGGWGCGHFFPLISRFPVIP